MSMLKAFFCILIFNLSTYLFLHLFQPMNIKLYTYFECKNEFCDLIEFGTTCLRRKYQFLPYRKIAHIIYNTLKY